jgi:hypothetical protein
LKPSPSLYAVSIADLQQTCERAQKESLPFGPCVPVKQKTAWMQVEHFRALNPERTIDYACAKLGIDRNVYEEGARALVGARDSRFSARDRMGPRHSAKGNHGKG